MSRIGKAPIALPPKVQVTVKDDVVTVTGPKGTLAQPVTGVDVAVTGGQVVLTRREESPQGRALHGLFRALLANAVKGVSVGYERELEIIGVGYKAEAAPNGLKLSLGFSHVIEYPLPPGIKAEIGEKGVKLKLSGIDKQLVGQVAAEIRSFRKPEPYKGKGVRYAGEKVVQKAGKAGKAGGKGGKK